MVHERSDFRGYVHTRARLLADQVDRETHPELLRIQEDSIDLIDFYLVTVNNNLDLWERHWLDNAVTYLTKFLQQHCPSDPTWLKDCLAAVETALQPPARRDSSLAPTPCSDTTPPFNVLRMALWGATGKGCPENDP